MFLLYPKVYSDTAFLTSLLTDTCFVGLPLNLWPPQGENRQAVGPQGPDQRLDGGERP